MKVPAHATALTALMAALCAFGEEAQQPAASSNSPLAEAAKAAPTEPAQATPAQTEKTQAEPAQAPAEAPAAAQDKTANAATARDTTDEIDLDEIDDSAEARGQEPVVSATASSNDVTLVDIACDNATLEDVLRQFRKVTDANIISDDSTNLQRRVSVNLHRVYWLDGLQSILNSRSYRLEERGSIYFVREDKVLEPVLTRSFTLNHASASELAALFNKSYGKKDAKGAIIVPVASCFDAANVVVVTATEKVIGECESIIKAVDKAVAQIYIEARFLELSSEAMHKLGMQWDKLKSWGASVENLSGSIDMGVNKSLTINKDGSLGISRKDDDTRLDGTAGSTRSLSFSDTRDSSSDQSRHSSRAATMSHGFSGQLSADDFRLALSAFESFGEGKIFSNPKVIVSNGKEANVDMTTKFPNVKLTSQRNNSDYGSYLDMSAQLEQIQGDKDKGLFAGSCFFEWGITLKVKPRISPDGLISVEITPTISQLDKDALPLRNSDPDYVEGFYSVKSDTSVGMFPIISMKRITTDFTMKDGSTAVIGGLSRTEEDDVDSGIPYLRRIPWIGQKLFGWKSREKVQREIIVCVTLGIANPAELPKDIGLPKNAIMGREYINGSKLEPGDRKGPAHEALKLDFRTLDEQKKADDAPGTVTITPAS